MIRAHYLGKTMKMVLALAALCSLSGCTVKPKPPLFNLYNYQRLAVVPFTNQSPDQNLDLEVMDATVAQIVRLGAAAVVESAQVSPYMASLGTDPFSAPGDPQLLKKLGVRFKSDILMTGSVDSYQEIREYTVPKRVIVNNTTGEAEWGFYTNRRVTVGVTAKLLDPATGSLLWTQKSSGYGSLNKWQVLPIPGNLNVPGAGMLENAYRLAKHQLEREAFGRENRRDPRGDQLLYKRDKVMADLRLRAIASAAGYLTADFKGRGNWTPTLQGRP